MAIISIDCAAEGKTGDQECEDGSYVSGIIFGAICLFTAFIFWACATEFGHYGCCRFALKCSTREERHKLDDSGFEQAQTTHSSQIQELQRKIAAESPIEFLVKSMAGGQQINLTTAKSTTVIIVANQLGADKMMLGSIELSGSQTLESQAVMDGTILTVPAFRISSLPEGWEPRLDPEGKKYYVNHNDKSTQWKLPDGHIPVPASDSLSQDLKVRTGLEIQLDALEAAVPQRDQFIHTEEACSCAPDIECKDVDWDQTKWCPYMAEYVDNCG